ncbi:MAG: hypothetical protein KKC46_08735 [Proteobacteria bacterium]|nr:hypothetical protein [Pseudomonadota bacterium]
MRYYTKIFCSICIVLLTCSTAMAQTLPDAGILLPGTTAARHHPAGQSSLRP